LTAAQREQLRDVLVQLGKIKGDARNPVLNIHEPELEEAVA